MGIAHSTKSARMILKTAVSHRGTETTEAADKELYLRNALKNCDPLGEDKGSETARPSTCSVRSVTPWQFQTTAGFRMIRLTGLI